MPEGYLLRGHSPPGAFVLGIHGAGRGKALPRSVDLLFKTSKLFLFIITHLRGKDEREICCNSMHACS